MKILILIFLLGVHSPLVAQNFGGTLQDDVSSFEAETKQLNQFMRRFNAEEDKKGERYYQERDSMFRNAELRQKYIPILFDNQSSVISLDLKKDFIEDITKKQKFLDFGGGKWFAEASAIFLYKKKEVEVKLFLQIEEETGGFKWVLSNVYFPEFNNLFGADPNSEPNRMKFLHPLSHELDFMDLRKVFGDPRFVESFNAKNKDIDYLSIFEYEVKRGNLQFETVQSVKYHFFQVENWYFEVSYYNRSGYNRGWLISSLSPVSPQDAWRFEKFIQTRKRY